MKPKTLILVVVAVGCGLGASYMTARLLAERQPVQEERVRILVARRPLSVGEHIVKPEEMFEIKEVTKENEPPDAVKDFEALKGKRMRQGRNRGDHITPSNLYDKDGLDIPEGHQAVGVPVNLVTTAHGLASLPGSRVDLILTVRSQDANRSTSRVLLENVLVLAADGRTNREGEIIAPAQVVTFALKEQEKLKVKLAEQLGSLSLSLRKLNDVTSAKERIITGADILGETKKEETAKAVEAPKTEPTKKEPVEEPKAPERPKYTRHEVTVVNGAQIGRRSVERIVYYKTEDGQIHYDEPGTEPAAPAVTPPARVMPQPAPQQPQRQPEPANPDGRSQDF